MGLKGVLNGLVRVAHERIRACVLGNGEVGENWGECLDREKYRLSLQRELFLVDHDEREKYQDGLHAERQ